MLPAIDPDEYFIDVESVTEALVLSFQSACIDGSELDTPKADRLAADGDTPFRQ